MLKISTVHAPAASLYPQIFLAHEQYPIKFDGLLFILQKFFSYYNNQVVNKKMLEDV